MKLGTHLLVLGLALSFVVACGNKNDGSTTSGAQSGNPTGPNSIYGGWKGNSTKMTDGIVIANLSIESNQITLNARCEYDNGTRVEASVSSPIQVDSSTIRVMENRYSSKTVNGKSCTTWIAANVYDYKVSNNVLRISLNNESMVFERSN